MCRLRMQIRGPDVADITQRRDAPLAHVNDKEHRRVIAMRANVGLPIDGTKSMNAPLSLKSYTAADLPDATLWEGAWVWVSDAGLPAYSDGTNWVYPGVDKPYAAKDSTYVITLADYLIECTANSFTVTLPTAVGIAGREFEIQNSGTGEITVDGDGAETINATATKILRQYDAMKVMSNGSSWVIV